MSFLRQILGLNGKWIRIFIVFIFFWGLIVFLFVTKLTGSNSGDGKSDTEYIIKRLDQAYTYLEQQRQRNNELKNLIDQIIYDKSYQPEHQEKLIEEIERKFQESSLSLSLIAPPLETNLFNTNTNQQNNNNFLLSESNNYNNNNNYNNLNGAVCVPSLEYEQLRRRVRSNTQEFWNYVQSEISKLRKFDTVDSLQELHKELDEMYDIAGDHKRAIINDVDQLRKYDGYEKWREDEAKDLSNLVQKRLNYLQNPDDCGKARKILCRLNKGCGYGCQLHHVVYCFIMAYATERTLILQSKGWRYHKGGWDEVFKSVSDTCTDASGVSHASWSGAHNQHQHQVLELPIIDSLNPRPPYLPLAIPEDLAPRLMRLHGDPIVWWIGQFLKYLLRPQPDTEQMLNSGRDRFGFKHPIVGVHVRRTDKVGTEASLHKIDEYMLYVEEYFKEIEMHTKIDKRRVFLASDDPKVIEEARNKYPDYEIIGDAEVARMAGVATRYTDSSLNGIILDIHLLSLCDFLVCTFSSQVCRVAYEIMQGMYIDASAHFKSLDDIYYYGGQNSHNREVFLAHNARNSGEISMKIGDLIGVAGNHWNGYSKGKNTRTNQIGLFPSYKVNDKIEVADFPKYSHIK